ncbi:MAG: hypothetical protein RLZZ245_1570 [Verrucomicrobiota bacterium]
MIWHFKGDFLRGQLLFEPCVCILLAEIVS